MLRSMTGFGIGEASLGASRISVEARSVNHRFLETGVRLLAFAIPAWSEVCVFGAAPNALEAPEKILLRARSCTCVSMPTTTSPVTAGARSGRGGR